MKAYLGEDVVWPPVNKRQSCIDTVIILLFFRKYEYSSKPEAGRNYGDYFNHTGTHVHFMLRHILQVRTNLSNKYI